MDLTTCLKKMKLVGVLAFATVDSEGAPQIRNISAIHYETDAIYFLTARGKNFCRELQEDGRVQILCYTKYKEMIRMSGRAYEVSDDEQIKWRDMIFEEQPYLANVYPQDTREICTIFCIDKADIEYFNLGVNPIFREIYHLGDDIISKSTAQTVNNTNDHLVNNENGNRKNSKNNAAKSQKPQKGYYITDACIGCGNCMSRCPQRCIDEGKPFSIRQNNCLHCGACFENCPVQAIQRVG